MHPWLDLGNRPRVGNEHHPARNPIKTGVHGLERMDCVQGARSRYR